MTGDDYRFVTTLVLGAVGASTTIIGLLIVLLMETELAKAR